LCVHVTKVAVGISDFKKVHPVGGHADTCDRNDRANSCFLLFMQI